MDVVHGARMAGANLIVGMDLNPASRTPSKGRTSRPHNQ